MKTSSGECGVENRRASGTLYRDSTKRRLACRSAVFQES